MKTTLALEFATNMFGLLKPHIKERLEAVIQNPCQETWDDAYSIILDGNGMAKTLWNAVLEIDPTFQRSASTRDNGTSRWERIPTSEEIVKAINNVVIKPNLN